MIYRRNYRPGKPEPIRKSRTVADVVVALPNDDFYNPSHVIYQSTPNGPVTMSTGPAESITYSTRRPGKGRQRANICYHSTYRRRYSGNPSALSLKAFQAGYESWFYSQHISLAGTNHTSAETEAASAYGFSMGANFLNSGAQGYANDTFVKLAPDLKKFSLPNDLFEWKELGNLVKLWNKSTNTITNLAGAHLNYKFGWKPLIGDLYDLAQGLIDIRGKLDFMKVHRGVVISSRRSFLNSSVVKTGTVVLDAYNTRLWRGQVDRVAHGYLVYTPLPILTLGKIDETVRALMAVTGIELNPRIAWDAIPFTFVVDWFLSVGDMLDTFKSSALELPIQIIEVYLDYKESNRVDSWMKYSSSGGISFDRTISAGTVSESRVFHRLPFMPDFATFGSLKARWPTLNQAELLVSLGAVLGGNKISTFFRKTDTLASKIKSRVYDYDDPGVFSTPF